MCFNVSGIDIYTATHIKFLGGRVELHEFLEAFAYAKDSI